MSRIFQDSYTAYMTISYEIETCKRIYFYKNIEFENIILYTDSGIHIHLDNFMVLNLIKFACEYDNYKMAVILYIKNCYNVNINDILDDIELLENMCNNKCNKILTHFFGQCLDIDINYIKLQSPRLYNYIFDVLCINSLKIVQYIYENYNINTDEFTRNDNFLICNAMRNKNIKLLMYLFYDVKLSIDNFKLNRGLIKVYQCGYLDVIEFLYNIGFVEKDFMIYDNMMLICAYRNCKIDVLTFIFRSLDINKFNLQPTLLHIIKQIIA